MKKYVFTLLLLSVFGCKTLSKSMSLGAVLGVSTGAGLGGGIYWKNRKDAAILAGIIGAGAGIASSYYIYKDRNNELNASLENVRDEEKKAFDTKISEALSQCMDDDQKPILTPIFKKSRVKGDRLIGGRTDWLIKPGTTSLTPEKQKLLEQIIKEKED